MNYLALYRKYRPTNFDEICGQKYIVEVLKNSLNNNRLSHAYLFSGPRGTGKTTMAKFFAKVVNCEKSVDLVPCDKCESCLAFNEKNHPDIVEIDAASNNGVDEIRQIRDNVNLLPVLSKYKVYIIDEVHMLSSGAFNALLKTLEEPPKHVVFILATTEFYKVPETIVSRCQCFEFERLKSDDIVSRLKVIALAEKMNIDNAVFSLIAEYCDGGMRDAIGMLDKLYCYSNNISVDDFYDLSGIISDSDYAEIVNKIISFDYNFVIKKVEILFFQGKNVILIADGLLNYIKKYIVNGLKSNDNNLSKYFNLFDIISDLIIKMRKSSNPKIIFEVGLLEFINSNSSTSTSTTIDEESAILSNNVLASDHNEGENIILNVSTQNKNIMQDKSINYQNNFKEEEFADFYDKRNKVRINNALFSANKNKLEIMKEKWEDLNNYLHNNDFCFSANFLLDSCLRVVGEEDAIISVMYDSNISLAYQNIGKLELLFGIVFDKQYRLSFILDSEWINIKNKYISDKKNGILYTYIEEHKINDIIDDESKKKKSNANVETAFNLFGDDVVEIKK